MSDRKRILIFSILVMAGGMFCTAAVTLAILYKLELKEQRDHLMGIAEGQAHFIEAVARFDTIHSQDDHPGGAREATLSQIAAAHEHYSGFGETGELVVAQREGDQIVFLFPHRHGDGSDPDPIPWRSELAEPMRLALSGQEGTLFGLDYRGQRVLAAYHHVPTLNLGVVAKTDMAEVRGPFVTAAVIAGGVTVLLVLVGVGLTLRVTDPLVRQLQESEERFRSYIHSAATVVVVLSPDFRILEFNPGAERLYGQKRDDVLGLNYLETFIPNNVRAAIAQDIHKVLEGETTQDFENEVLGGDGDIHVVTWNVNRILDAHGHPAGVIAVGLDVTQRKQAENELRKLSVVVEQSPAIVVITDTSGTIEYVNPRFTEVTGYTKEEAIGQNPRMLKSGKWPRRAYEQLWKTILAGKTWRGEFENKKKNGELYWESASISPVRNAQGEVTHFLAVKEDITKRRAVEDRLRTVSAETKQINRALLAINETQQALFACRSETQVAQVVTDALASEFGAYFSRVWLRRPGDLCAQCALSAQCPDKQECLHLLASSGYYTHTDGDHRRVPIGVFKIGLIAQGRGETICNDVVHDDRVHDQKWAAEHKLQAFAGLPLVDGEEVIGVMAMFCQSQLPSHLLDSLGILAKLAAAAFVNVRQINDLRNARGDTEAANMRLEDRRAKLQETNAMLEVQTARAGEMAARAEMASAAKSQFLANMSHEIRTPMTAILGYADVLSEGLTDPVSIDAVRTIERNGQHLLELINDILDLSKVESGKMTVENRRCDLMQLIGDVAASLRPRAEAKNIHLNVKYAGAIPQAICTDPTRLRQALMNLVGNAIKFTAQGGVTIRVGLLGNKSGPELLIELVDTGIGVPPDRLSAIFEPFQQADSSTSRMFGGTGLGLTISKRIAELLGGGLEVQSEVGKGSVFALRVATGALDGVEMIDQPVDEAGSRYEAEKQPATEDLDCRVLLVEDGPDNQRLIAFILKKAGAEVEVADNGKIGVDLALAATNEGRPFDVILMDMQMPVMDGYEATALLRRKGYTGPIIALTAHAMDGDRQKCLDAGCDDYATKPVDRKRLIATIRTCIPRGETAMPSQENATEAPVFGGTPR